MQNTATHEEIIASLFDVVDRMDGCVVVMTTGRREDGSTGWKDGKSIPQFQKRVMPGIPHTPYAVASSRRCILRNSPVSPFKRFMRNKLW
jgi:hypothetical protein